MSFHSALALTFAAALVLPPGGALAQEEKPVSSGAVDSAKPLFAFGEDPSRQLIIGGFGDITYLANTASGQNTFGDSALAISFSKLITDQVSAFAQLTASHEPPSPFVGEEETSNDVSVDIDNLILTWTPSAQAGLQLTLGKFDSVLAVERDDAPLDYLATHSWTFDFARPVKFTGLQAYEAFSPQFELWGILANGWDNDFDMDKGKTGALYGRWSPTLSSHIGLGGMYGSQTTGSIEGNRAAAVATLLFQLGDSWVVGGEGVAGSQANAIQGGGKAHWYAGFVFAQYRFGKHGAISVRADSLDDREGFLTGTRQVLRSYTLSPQFLLGSGLYRAYRTMEGTTLRLPELWLRLDLRENVSTEPVFQSGTEGVGQKNAFNVAFEAVFVF
jgi:hypothetical protein